MSEVLALEESVVVLVRLLHGDLAVRHPLPRGLPDALHELALAEGVPSDAVEDAMDDNDPKTVLIRLVTARRATEPSEA